MPIPVAGVVQPGIGAIDVSDCLFELITQIRTIENWMP